MAHPGLITSEEAKIAAGNGVFLEISARKGHAFSNGHVVNEARKNGAKTILDSDAHAPEALLTREFAMKVALGAGILSNEIDTLLETNPRNLLSKVSVPQ